MAVKGRDFVQAAFEVERRLDPRIAHISHRTDIVGTDTTGLVEPADETRLVSNLTRPVTGAWPIRHAPVERHTNKADLNTVDVFPVR
jgi:hypothetical protein